ncbi:MAG: hypothetical protein GXY64_07305 [Bacteroidales bacterium]|nr:hypothetical protein [Bacteroidales bacterium]
MSLIKCPECGREVSDLAASCPHCGCPINEHVARLVADRTSGEKKNQNSPAPKKQTRATATIVVMSLVILSLAGAAVWFLFFGRGSDMDERAAYDRIMRFEKERQFDSLDVALNEYIDTYNSDAFHYSQIKELSDRFSTERSDWEAVKGVMSLQSVRRFLDMHPDGFFHKNADEKLDSLSFVEAENEDTKEAYDRYLSEFNNGRFAEEAHKKISDLDKEELTIEEQLSVKKVLSTHFDALADNDKTSIASTLASRINSYIGKANPEMEDIYAYMSGMHSSSRQIVFNVKTGNVTKVKVGDRSVFNAQFVLEEEAMAAGRHNGLDTEYGNAEEKSSSGNVKRFIGTAVLNENMKITSLVLRQ